MPFGVWREIRRLGGANGTVKDLLELVYACCYLRRRSSREDVPEWTEDLRIAEIAEVLGVCQRMVEYAIQYVVGRRIMEIRRQGVQRCSLRLKLEAWAKAPDYEPFDAERSRPVNVELPDDDDEDDDVAPETAPAAAGPAEPVRITGESGLLVKAGSQATPIAVPPAQFARVRSVVVASVDPKRHTVLDMLIVGGELRVTLYTQDSHSRPEAHSRSNGIKDLLSESRKSLHGDGGGPVNPEVAEHQRITDRAAKTGRLKSFKQIQREEEDEQLEKYMRMRRGEQ